LNTFPAFTAHDSLHACLLLFYLQLLQGGSNMTGTDLYVNKCKSPGHIWTTLYCVTLIL